MQTKDLTDILSATHMVAEKLCNIVPDCERSSAVTGSIRAMLHLYYKILQENKKKSKPWTLHSFFICLLNQIVVVLRRFNLQQNIRERNIVVKRDINVNDNMPTSVAARPKVWVYGPRLLGLLVRILPGAWMSCYLSVRGLRVGIIIRPEESYRVWRVCDCECRIINGPWLTMGYRCGQLWQSLAGHSDNILGRMRIACFITKVSDTRLEYVIFVVAPRQQWSCESLSLLIL
jgi:hypothetical protein